MTDQTIAVSCPKCRKGIKAPAALAGKRIKCKGCGETFPIPAPAAPTARAPEDEEWGVIKAYAVDAPKERVRCPFCAWELENDDDILCLHCGYNLRTRERLAPRVLHPVTGGDYVMHLLPGVLALLGALAFIGLIVVIWTGTPDLWVIYMGWLQDWQPGQVYGTVFCLFVTWACGFFAVKRLILNPHPPEKEKRIKKKPGNG